jgi:hypothetical protein
MRHVTFLCFFALGCASSEDPEEVPIDVEGEWTADFLLNTTAATPGRDKTKFGDLLLAEPTYDEGHEQPWKGNAKLTAVAHAPQGSLQNPTLDDMGEVLYEPVGTLVYRGIWRAREDATDFSVNVDCEEVMLSADRPDLQAVCGDPFPVDVSFDCNRPEGGTTINCSFGSDQAVFFRK